MNIALIIILLGFVLYFFARTILHVFYFIFKIMIKAIVTLFIVFFAISLLIGSSFRHLNYH